MGQTPIFTGMRCLSQNQRGDIMLTWKRFFLASCILCVTVIMGWTIWYLCVVHPQSNVKPTIKAFNTKNARTAEDTPDDASVETSQEQKISQEGETVDRHAEGAESTAPLVSKELNQHTHHSDKPNDEELSAEELAEKKAEIERERKELEAYKDRINELGATLNELNKHSEIRNKELASHLNSLSAKEQQAYFVIIQ